MAQDPYRETVAEETEGADDRDLLETTGGAELSDVATATQGGEVERAGRYELKEEIARGGMGAVHLAIDRTLGRQVAVKLLRARFEPGSTAARRFVDEAHIAGQLQHPGIPPIHDLGTLPDGRPFLAMKLIKGQTLDAMLDGRADPVADRGRFIAVFEQVCQAVAYAHAHRVIHRDLKPQNIMVGAFGEVQVMDWGLAKVLGEAKAGRPPGDSDERLADEIKSARDPDSSETQAGSVLGTPAYMAPEQAVGAIERVDERSDVFGLGGVLAVILTGRPPFVGDTAESTRLLSARGQVEECFARLDTCGSEPELVDLCRRCLSPAREDRPADAGAVASRIADLRAEAEERARQAELDLVRAEGDRARVEAEARAHRQKRRTQIAAAAGIVGLMVVGGAAWTAVRGQAEARRADAGRVASVALGRADQLAAQAGAIDAAEVAEANTAAKLWEQAEAAAAQSEGAIAGVGDLGLEARVREKTATVRSGRERARRDAALLAALDAVDGADSGTVGGEADRRATVRAYRAAFEAAGLPEGGDAVTLATAVAAERSGLRAALLRALDRWTDALETSPPDPDADRVRATADLVDPDPIRKEIRASMATGDAQALARLAERLGGKELPAASAVLLGFALREKKLGREARKFLRSARDRSPADLWLLANLHWSLLDGEHNDPVLVEEAAGCVRTMVAIRPENAFGHYQLGQVFIRKHDLDSAEAQFRKTIELNPGYTFAMNNLGAIRDEKGDLAGAGLWYRKAAEADPAFGMARSNLADVLRRQGDFAAAEAEYRKALERLPDAWYLHDPLGGLLEAKGDLAGAEQEFSKNVARYPKNKSFLDRQARVRQFATLLPRLDDVLAGRASPADPAEAAAFARLCGLRFRGQYSDAIRLYERAFADDPKLLDDLSGSHRYNAACSAAKAGNGQGADASADPSQRAAFRMKALAWLRADLALWSKKAASDKQPDRNATSARLMLWLEDSNFAAVRPGDARYDLPAAERPAWDSLWSDVRASIEAARKPIPPASAKP